MPSRNRDLSSTSTTGSLPHVFRNDPMDKLDWEPFEFCIPVPDVVLREEYNETSINIHQVYIEKLPAAVKSNSAGSGRPLGKQTLGSRSSSKNGWAQAST
jgi:hypothetical protein